MNDARPPILPMLLANLAQTLLTVVACVVAGYVLSLIVNWVAHPAATGVRWGGGGDRFVSSDQLVAYDAVRDTIVSFSATAGLFAIQTVFLVRHLWTPPAAKPPTSDRD